MTLTEHCVPLPDTRTAVVVIAVGRYGEDAPLGGALGVREGPPRRQQPLSMLGVPVPLPGGGRYDRPLGTRGHPHR